MRGATWPWILLSLALLAPAQDAVAAPAVRGAYRWTSGKPVRYRLRAEVKLTTVGDTDPLTATATLVYRITPQRLRANAPSRLALTYEKLDTQLLGQPIAISDDQARKALNRTVALAVSGAVTNAAGAQGGAINTYIPGVEPGRLYALLFPVVFPQRAIRPGDTWTYNSPLLGTAEAPVPFTATALAQPTNPKPQDALQVATSFAMGIDIALDREGKPALPGSPAMVTRRGRIDGAGTYTFDAQAGRLLKGSVQLKADMKETHAAAEATGPPEAIERHVDATITVQLLPSRPAAPARRRRT